ncbi:hypothetical protein EV361DRAFT_911398 [Lentinula raphanica]|nr:hypothetical protein EV361DRAFT_911398 [Lentinula raphanica]
MDLEGYGGDKDGTKVGSNASSHLQIQLAYEQSPAHPCQIWRFEEVEPPVAIAGLDSTILAPDEIIFDPKSISDSEEEESQYSSSDFDSKDNSSDDEFHDASEDGLDLEGIVQDFPGHTNQMEPGEIMHTGAAGTTMDISRVDDVDSKDSEKYRKKLQKSWSNSMTVTRTTSTVCSVSKGALSTGKK